jgi:hypothetical protein
MDIPDWKKKSQGIANDEENKTVACIGMSSKISGISKKSNFKYRIIMLDAIWQWEICGLHLFVFQFVDCIKLNLGDEGLRGNFQGNSSNPPELYHARVLRMTACS